MAKRLSIADLRAMTDEELLKLSKQKNARGRYTAEANRAMDVRRERSLYWDGVPSRPPAYDDFEDVYRRTDIHMAKIW